MHGDRWVTVEVRVRGGSASSSTWSTAQSVLRYGEPQLDEGDPQGRKLIKNGKKILEGGFIYLQSESHPVEFRKVELLTRIGRPRRASAARARRPPLSRSPMARSAGRLEASWASSGICRIGTVGARWARRSSSRRCERALRAR